MPKKEIDSQENKLQRLVQIVSKIEKNKGLTPTRIGKEINMHHDTVENILLFAKSMEEIPYTLIMDEENNKIKMVIGTEPKNLKLLKELAGIKTALNDLNIKLEENKEKK